MVVLHGFGEFGKQCLQLMSDVWRGLGVGRVGSLHPGPDSPGARRLVVQVVL